MTPSPFALLNTDAAAESPLQLGQSVHIDLPWSSHPLPVSDLCICRVDQLAALRALPPGRVRIASVPDRAAGMPQPARLSRHAQRVLAALRQLWPDDVPGRPVDAPDPASTAPPPAVADDLPLDPVQCRRQLVEAAREAAELVALLSTPPDELPPDLEALRAADAVHAAERLARALAAKLTGVPSAYVRALCEDAAQHAFPPAIHVAVLSLLLARAVQLDGDALHAVLLGALLHGVGRHRLAAQRGRAIAAPGSALHEHPVAHGVEWGRRAGLPAAVLQVLAQQQQADGDGFPPRLQAERLDGPARIVALVDCYDKLCHPPAPAVGMAPHVALARLFAIGAAQFDVPLLRAFVRVMGVYPPGSLVQLSDQRYARVVGSDRPRPLRPPVRVIGREPRPGAGSPLLLGADPALRVHRGPSGAQPPPRRRDRLVAAGDDDPFVFAFAFASDAEAVLS